MKHQPIYNKHFEKLLFDFDKEVKTKGYGNADMMVSMVREFLFFMEGEHFSDIKKIRAAEIVSYYEYLRERPNYRREGGLSDSMIRHHLYSLRLFFDYLMDAGEIESSPARLPKFSIVKYKERNILSVEEIKLLYRSCETKRDRALISIAYGCGLRRTEIQNLNVTDVLLNKGQLLVREGKGGKYRSVPISDSVLKDLKEYLVYERHRYLKNKFSPSFFINNWGSRMAGFYHNQRLKTMIGETQNFKLIRKEITLHCLRHSIATHLLDKGASMEFVQTFLGHSLMDTVLIYSKKRKQRQAIMNQIRKPNGKKI